MKNWSYIHITHLKKPSLLELLCRSLFFYREVNDRRLEVEWFLKRGSSEVGESPTAKKKHVHSSVSTFPTHIKIQVPRWGKMTRPNPITRTSSAVRPTPTILGGQVSTGQLGLAKSDLSESQTYRMLWAGWWKERPQGVNGAGKEETKQNKKPRNCLSTLKRHPKLPPTIASLQQMAQDQSLSFLPDQCVFSAHTYGSFSNGNTGSLR